MRPIDADALDVEQINCYYGDHCRTEDVQEWLEEAPTIDYAPVIHARWEKQLRGVVRCSYCDRGYRITNGGANVLNFAYCPNCGARMKEAGKYEDENA